MKSKFDFESLKYIRALSLNDNVEKTFDSWYGNVCRWYSRTFSTPLPQVEEMPPEKVLKTYYDDIYYRLVNSEDEKSSELLQKEIEMVVNYNKPDEEIEEIEAQAEEEDEKWYQEELKKLETQLKNTSNPNLIDTGKDEEIVEVEDAPPVFDEDE